MFKLSQTNVVKIDSDLVALFFAVIVLVLIYFFSFQLQKLLLIFFRTVGKKIGLFAKDREYAVQRYVYQHDKSLIARLYRWINDQLVVLGVRRLGVTPMGYLMFWSVISLIASTVLVAILRLGMGFFVLLSILLVVVALVMTRVTVSERLEKREADIMNAIDLIVPEVRNGIKNAIVTYQNNFAQSIREDFIVFIINIQDRGYSFEAAMIKLSDDLGSVFKDFAQKAIYFETVGELDMIDIFTDISETNRLRRELRDENSKAFAGLKTTFIISTLLVVAYFIFIVLTDAFSREFFLQRTVGKFLLLVMISIVFAVLSYITTIKSKVI